MKRINLKDMLTDYQDNFVGKNCIVHTNYKPYSNCIIVFQLDDLYHLFGIHKLYKTTANKWVHNVLNDRFTIKDIVNHHKRNEVLDRIKHYNILHELFYGDTNFECIVEKDIQQNSMRLTLLFLKNGKKMIIVLGFRKDKHDKFHPVTLHEHYGNRYTGLRRTKITHITIE